MFQQTIVAGYLGGDPEMRYTSSGVEVCTFSLASSESWTGNDGQRQEKTTWYRVTAWRKLAELCANHLHKGSSVLVTGKMQEPRPYQDRDGNWRASLDLTIDEMRFLGKRGDNDGGGGGGNRSQQQSTPAQTQAPLQAPRSDDDSPF